MSRAAAIARAHTYFDSGEFLVDLRRRVAIPSTSQEPERAPALRRYLDEEVAPSLAPLGFTSRERVRSEEHTSELQSRGHLVCRLLLEKKKKNTNKESPL